MIRTFRTRIYPTAVQAETLRQYVGGARFAYNWGLEQWNKWVEDRNNGTRNDSPNWMKLSNMWTTEKPKWASGLPRIVVAYALRGVNNAFVLHFKRGCGWPRFKKRGCCKSTFHTDAFSTHVVRGGMAVHLVGVKKPIKLAERYCTGHKVLKHTFACLAGRWYMSAVIECDDTRNPPDSKCGVDVGMKNPAVCSDGTELVLPKGDLKRLDRRLRKAQHTMSRRRKDSRRRAKALLRCQRIRERINNIRRDCIHKFTSAVCKNHATVVIEDLNAAGLHRCPRNIRAGIHRSCVYEILRQIGYKAVNPVEASRWYPSTQLCSVCGARHKMTLKQRTYQCPVCVGL